MGGAGMECGDWGRMEWKVETGDMEWRWKAEQNGIEMETK